MPNIKSPKSYASLPSCPTLADLAQAIGRDTTMWKKRRNEIVGGMRSLAAAIGAHMEEVPARPGPLSSRIQASQPWPSEINEAERDRMRKLTRAAIERAGLAHVPGRYGEPLSRRWNTLVLRVESPSQRLTLAPLCRFASLRGIPPGTVDDDLSNDLLAAMRSDSLLKDVRTAHRRACRSWNLAVATVPGWPKRTITVPDYRNTYQVSWTDFPASLKAEIDRYLDGAAQIMPLTSKAYGPWSAITSDNIRKLLHSYVSAVVRGGSEPSSLRTLSDAVTLEAVRKALGFLLTRSNGQISVQTGNVAFAVASVARNWVGIDGSCQAELDALCKRVTPSQGGLSDGNRLLLRQFDKPSSVSAVLSLPGRLMKAADASDASARANARIVQTALVIELLVIAAIRVGELARLELGNISPVTARRGAMLSFQRYGRRGPVTVEIALPESTRRLLGVYTREHRPFLAAAGCTAMFPGRSGGAKTHQILRKQVSRAVLDFTGLTMTPNLFRHFAAKHFLNKHPGEFQVVRFALGHKSLQTTLDKYSEMDGPAAFRSADAAVVGSKSTPKRRGGFMDATGPR